jgi:hypothetical protein
MNNRIKAFLQCSAVAACMSFSSLSHADAKSITQFYNNPASAPKVTRCKGNVNCNAFLPCLKNGKSFPRTTNWSGYNLRSFIEDNDGDGLNRDFAPPQKDRAYQILKQVLLPLKKSP